MTQLRLTMRQRQDRARVIVTASKKTGDILPRHIYERAGAPVPPPHRHRRTPARRALAKHTTEGNRPCTVLIPRSKRNMRGLPSADSNAYGVTF